MNSHCYMPCLFYSFRFSALGKHTLRQVLARAVGFLSDLAMCMIALCGFIMLQNLSPFRQVHKNV